MNALEVAPGAEAGQVLVRVVPAVGAEAEVMRRHVAPPATRTLTAMAIALVDVRVFHVGTARAPRIHEELAREAQKGRVA